MGKQKKKVKQLYRCDQHRMIAGVCAGMAEYFACDPVLVRVVFFLSIFWGGLGVVLYVVCWACMPLSFVCLAGDDSKRLYRSMHQRQIAGVCGGIAAHFGIDPVWIRIKFILGALLFGYMVFIYVLLWCVLPCQQVDCDAVWC